MSNKWRKMSKRVLTIVLSACMTMSSMPTYAAETDLEEISVKEIGIEENTNNETAKDEATKDEALKEEESIKEESKEEVNEEVVKETQENESEDTKEKVSDDEKTDLEENVDIIVDEMTALTDSISEVELLSEVDATEEAAKDENKEVVTSTTNTYFWDGNALLETANEAVNGLQIKGEGWTTATDNSGETEFGYGLYAKAGSAKPSPNNGAVPTTGCYIEFTAPDDGTFIICEKTQKSDKTFYVVDKSGNLVASAKSGSASTYDTIKADVVAGETYYAYMSGSTANVFSCQFVPTVKVTTWLAEAILNSASQEDNGLSIVGADWSMSTDSSGETEFGHGEYAKAGSVKPSPNNGAIPTTGCYLVYNASENGTLVIEEKTQKSNKTFYVVDNDGTVVAKVESGSVSTYDTINVDVVEGKTYYAYMSGSTANIFGVKFKTGKKTMTPWSEVKAPTINNVTVDNEGNLTVDYSVVIDEFKGATSATIIMYYDGYEASSTTITKSDAKVVFSPLWSGNYTFTIYAERDGEALKASDVYEYSNYVLPVKKPIVELAQNRGEAVYLDWINVDSADYYIVSYKENSEESYTVVDAKNTDGYATIDKLTAGAVYDFKIEAVRDSDSFVAFYNLDDFTVTKEAQTVWNFATVGSAQETHATVADKDGNVLQSVDMATKDETPNKQAIQVATTDIVNTDNTITFKSTGNGKISDGEEGFQYFYTMLDPNTQNFKLTATFELKEIYGNAFDNQSGYGIIATDMLGVNYYGTEGLWIKCKYLNSVSTQIYSKKANFVGQRNISGYMSSTTSVNEDMTRLTSEKKFSSVATNYEVGAKYTFVLEKTNDGYVSSVINEAGKVESISCEDLGIISVQEDGSIALGVFAARNAGVEISDIKFETSESTGVTSTVKEEATTPSVSVFSSGTTGTSEYEYIYLPNVDGKLVVSVNGKEYFNADVKGQKVTRVMLPMTLGQNAVSSVLTPDKSQKLANYADIKKNTTVEYNELANGKEVVYVAPDGKSNGTGTANSPIDIYTAVKYAAPGQTIVLKDGTYKSGDVKIERSVSGTSEKPITLVAENDKAVVFEGIGLNVIGSYWHVYGIYFHYPKAVGIQICGNYNTIEMCTVEGSLNTGIQISRAGNADRNPGVEEMLWPSYNLVKNCESFDNCDAGRNDADGFAAKLTCGEGNKFYGCIGHNNVDDGWDLFAKAISGEIGSVTIENCIAYNNGWLTYEDTTAAGYEYGEGNGFKLGGNDMYGAHVLKNSISFGNIGKGITSNSCPDCKVYNSISYGNAIGKDSAYNISLATKASNKQMWEVKGLISYTTNTTTADQIPNSFLTESNYLFNGKVSRNSAYKLVSDDWFESVDLSIVPTRNADGTINMHGLLNATELCPANAGARLDVSSDEAKSVSPYNKDEAVEKPETTTNNEANNSSSSETSTSEESSTATVSASSDKPVFVAANVDTTEVNGVPALVAALKDGSLVQSAFLNRIRANKMYLLVSVSKQVGFTFYGEDINADVNDINIKSELVLVNDFAEGFVTKRLKVNAEKNLGYKTTIHMNVGEEYVGKVAYLFQKNLLTGEMNSVGAMKVSEIGNVMIDTTFISDIYVLISK